MSPRPTDRMLRYALSAMVCLAAVLASGDSGADDAGQWLSRSQIARFPGDDMQAVFALRIERSDGKVVERAGRVMRRTRGGGLADRIYVIDKPSSLTGLAFLSKDVAGNPADQWLYLPAYKRVRRVAVHGAGDAFIGSDFIYADFGRVRQEAGRHSVIGDRILDGHSCVLVETLNLDSALPYTRTVSTIARDTALPLLVEFFSGDGRLLRRGLLEGVVDVDGHPTPMRISMANEELGSRSVLSLSGVGYDRGLSAELFTVESLEGLVGLH